MNPLFLDRKALTSVVAWIFLGLCLPYYFIFDYFGLYFARFFVFPTALPAVLALVCQRFGFFVLSRLILILGTGICLFAAADILGDAAGMQLLMLSLLPLPFVLFSFSEKSWVVLCVFWIFIAYLTMGHGIAVPAIQVEIMGPILTRRVAFFADVTAFFLLGFSFVAYFLSRHHDSVQMANYTTALEKGNLDLTFANQALSSAYDELQTQQKLLEKNWHDTVYATLTRTIAHELKNPLFEFGMSAEALKTALDDKETALMFINAMSETCGELQELLDVMLENGSVSVGEQRRMKVQDVVRRVLLMAEGSVKKRGIDLVREIDDVPEIMGDPKAYLMVVSNLVVNAMEAMPDGGRLTVRVMGAHPVEAPPPAPSQEGEIFLRGDHEPLVRDPLAYPFPSVEGCPEGGVVAEHAPTIIIVQDTGPGIAKERQEMLFGGGQSTKNISERQRGIGLALVHKLVTDMGGVITVESDPDVQPGTVFRIVV